MIIHSPLIFPKIETQTINGKLCWRLNSSYNPEERYGIFSMWVDINTKKPYCTECHSENVHEIEGIDWGGYCCKDCRQQHNDVGYTVFDALVENLTEENLEEIKQRSQYITTEDYDYLSEELAYKHRGDDYIKLSFTEDEQPREIRIDFRGDFLTTIKQRYGNMFDITEKTSHGDEVIKLKADTHYDFRHTPNTPYVRFFVYEFWYASIYEEENGDYTVVDKDKESTHNNKRTALEDFFEVIEAVMEDRWNEAIKEVEKRKEQIKRLLDGGDKPEFVEYLEGVIREINTNPWCVNTTE